MAVADEEARGGLGAKWLAEHHPDAFSWANCVGETGGSHIHGQDGSDSTIVYVGEKGAAQRRIHVYGDPGHGSAPYGKDLATVKIGEIARRLAATQPAVTDSDTWRQFVAAFRFDPNTTALVEQGKGYEHLGELAAYGDAISHLTIAQTVLRAGQAINVLPSHAWLELDIRTLPGQSQDYVDSVLYDTLGTDIEYTIEHLITEDATISPTNHPLYQAISAVFTDFFPDTTVVPTIAAGGSDLRFARRVTLLNTEEDSAGRTLSRSYRVTYTLTSTKSAAITTEVREQVYGQGVVVDGKAQNGNPATVVRYAAVPAGGQANVTFTVKVRGG